MSKKFKECKCVHCLRYFAELTSDHVFPVSWYPKTNPDNLEKWQMPSCEACNKKYGKIEEDLLLKLGLCVKPFSHESFGVADKTLRALNPKNGKNDRDSNIRLKKREQILREAIEPTTVPLSSILPNFGFNDGTAPNEQLAVLVPDKGLKSIGEKLIRGITWVVDNEYINENYEIEIYIYHELDADFLEEKLNKFGKTYALGPGIQIIRVVTRQDPICGIYSMEIWGQLKIYGIVSLLKSKETGITTKLKGQPGHSGSENSEELNNQNL